MTATPTIGLFNKLVAMIKQNNRNKYLTISCFREHSTKELSVAEGLFYREFVARRHSADSFQRFNAADKTLDW